MVAAGIFVLSGLDVEGVFLGSEFITRVLIGFVVSGCFLRVVSTNSFSDCSLPSLSFSEEVFLGSEFITRFLIGFVIKRMFSTCSLYDFIFGLFFSVTFIFLCNILVILLPSAVLDH